MFHGVRLVDLSDGRGAEIFEGFAGVGDLAFDCGGGDHDGRHEDGASDGGALTAFEVPVGRGGADLIADEFIGVHREAHGAACGPPFESGFFEDFIEAFLLALDGGDLRSGNGDGGDTRGDLFALEVFGGFAEVGEAAIGAGADEGYINGDAFDRGSGGELHVGEGFLDDGSFFRVRGGGGIGDVFANGDAVVGGNSPGDGGLYVFGIDGDDVIELRVGIGGEGFPAGDGFVPLGSGG